MGVQRRRGVGHNKERPEIVVEEYILEAVRLVKTSAAIYLHEKEQEGKDAIARVDMN